MRPRSFSLNRAPLALAGVGLLLAAGLGAASTKAASVRTAPMLRLAAQTSDLTATAEALVGRLGSHTAGDYLDRVTGQVVVTVTDAASADEVHAAGLVPRLVQHSGAELRAIDATLTRSNRIVGTAWAVDPSLDAVVVSLDSTVTAQKSALLTVATRRFGNAVRFERVAGRFRLLIAGGDAIYGGKFRCSLGFNVLKGGAHYSLTAGHCGKVASRWYANAGHTSLLGPVAGYSFPKNDYSIVKITNSAIKAWGSVDLYNGKRRDMTKAGKAFVGEAVTRSGSTSHVHTGTVKALNATVFYAEGTVYGMIKTNVCAEPGDSGGPLFAKTTALGLTSGGSGDCKSGGTTFYQPVTEALNAYGASIY